jgi:hypothetical protein
LKEGAAGLIGSAAVATDAHAHAAFALRREHLGVLNFGAAGFVGTAAVATDAQARAASVPSRERLGVLNCGAAGFGLWSSWLGGDCSSSC